VSAEPKDERSNLEKLDDLQATHPFPYNLVAGALVGVVVVLVFDVPVLLGAIYAVAYGTLRWYLWQPGRVLRRQYEARAERWAATQAERRRQHG
jgi:hypothetical protein